jgi:hypothetical protein
MFAPSASERLYRLFRVFVIGIAFLSGFSVMPVLAQDEEAPEEPPAELMKKPIVTIAVGSVERLKTDIKHIFDVAGRSDIYEAMESGLENMGDLKGMEQTKPFGAMVFLRAGMPPVPEVVGFAPVEKIEDLTKTLEIGPVVTKKIDDTHYEIIGMRGEFQVLLKGGYAFISNEAEVLENDFPDPVRSTKGLTSKFDIGITLNLDSIPRLTRDLFMGFVKAQANADLQQRDDEPDGVYKMRRASSQHTLTGLTQVMNELERLTIGIDADAEKSEMAFEIVMDAQEDSKLAKEMKRINSKRNYYETLLDENAPMTLSASFPMVEKDKEFWTDIIDGGALTLQSELFGESEDSDDGPLPPALTNMFDALRDTVKEGHTNMFMQFYGEPGAFSIVGGVKLVGGKAVGGGIRDLLERLSGDLDVEVGSVELDAESHNDISFHHIAAKDADEAERMFGDQLGVYIGADNRTLWFAIGGDAAFEKTTELMDTLAEPKPANRKRSRRAPMQMIFNINQWLGLDEDGEGVFFDAFEEGGDRVTVDVRTTDDGMRIRAQAEEGVIRLFGMGIGRRFDRRGERRNRGGGRRGRPGGDGSERN